MKALRSNSGREGLKEDLIATVFVLVLGLLVPLTAICWWAALTAPMIASDGPIMLSIFLSVIVGLLWWKRRKFV